MKSQLQQQYGQVYLDLALLSTTLSPVGWALPALFIRWQTVKLSGSSKGQLLGTLIPLVAPGLNLIEEQGNKSGYQQSSGTLDLTVHGSWFIGSSYEL